MALGGLEIISDLQGGLLQTHPEFATTCHNKDRSNFKLVGGFNPFEKYARQIGSFPQGSGWKYKIFELPPPSKAPQNFSQFPGFLPL